MGDHAMDQSRQAPAGDRTLAGDCRHARILVSRVLYTLECGLPGMRSGGFLARVRPITPLERGDLLATFSAGAYGMINASTYNTRP